MKRFLISEKNRHLYLLMLFILMVQNCYTISVVKPTFKIKEFSKLFWDIISGICLFAGLLALVGIFIKNKPLNFFGAWKFVVFIFAGSTCYRIGKEHINGFRGMNEGLFTFWYNRTIESLFGAEYNIMLFKSVQDEMSLEYSNWRNFYNTTLIDTSIFIIFRIIGFGKSKWMKNLAIFGPLTYGIRTWSRAYQWWKQDMDVMRDNKLGNTYERKSLTHTITWILWSIMIIILIEAIIKLFISAVGIIKGPKKKNGRRAAYTETGKDENNPKPKMSKKK